MLRLFFRCFFSLGLCRSRGSLKPCNSLHSDRSSPPPTHDNWQAFLSALGLGGSGSPPEDAALFLESLVEPEPALRSRLELVEELTVECIGCGDHRVLRSAELVHRVTAPSEPTDLQSLLLDDFARLDEEREVSCPQCFASTAVPTARTCRPGQALFIQIRRGGVHATKNTTPVSFAGLTALRYGLEYLRGDLS